MSQNSFDTFSLKMKESGKKKNATVSLINRVILSFENKNTLLSKNKFFAVNYIFKVMN